MTADQRKQSYFFFRFNGGCAMRPSICGHD